MNDRQSLEVINEEEGTSFKFTKSKARDCTPQISPPNKFESTSKKNNYITFGGCTPHFNKPCGNENYGYLMNQSKTLVTGDGLTNIG